MKPFAPFVFARALSVFCLYLFVASDVCMCVCIMLVFMCVQAGSAFSGPLDLGAWKNVNLTCSALLDLSFP